MMHIKIESGQFLTTIESKGRLSVIIQIQVCCQLTGYCQWQCCCCINQGMNMTNHQLKMPFCTHKDISRDAKTPKLAYYSGIILFFLSRPCTNSQIICASLLQTTYVLATCNWFFWCTLIAKPMNTSLQQLRKLTRPLKTSDLSVLLPL